MREMISLDRFVEGGLDTVPPNQLTDLARDVKDLCYATGDVHLCVLADCIETIASCWGDDGAVKLAFVDKLQRLILGPFAEVLAVDDPDAARSLALNVREELHALIAESADMHID